MRLRLIVRRLRPPTVPSCRGRGMSEYVRLSVNLNKETAAALRELAEASGTATEAVRRAISIAKYLYDEQANGRVIHTMDPDGGHKRELVLM
jgi:hypothetical protein